MKYVSSCKDLAKSEVRKPWVLVRFFLARSLQDDTEREFEIIMLRLT
jgi:hypothetical protein